MQRNDFKIAFFLFAKKRFPFPRAASEDTKGGLKSRPAYLTPCACAHHHTRAKKGALSGKESRPAFRDESEPITMLLRCSLAIPCSNSSSMNGGALELVSILASSQAAVHPPKSGFEPAPARLFCRPAGPACRYALFVAGRQVCCLNGPS